MAVKFYNCTNTKRTVNDTPRIAVHEAWKRVDHRAEILLLSPDKTCFRIKIITINTLFLGRYAPQIPQNLLRKVFLIWEIGSQMLSNQENSRWFSQNKKVNSLRKIFLSLLQENLTWNKNISQNKTNFLNIKKTFLGKKIFIVSRKLFLFWDRLLKWR